MASVNKVLLLGNLTRDPELRVLPKGTSVCSFSLAMNRRFRDEGGNEREEVTFVDVEAWGKQADVIAKYLVKGRPLLVEGRLKLDQWEDRDTHQKRQRLKVVLESFQFLGAPPGSEARRSEDRGPESPEPVAAPAAAAPKPAGVDDDVPF